jgi:hypothetical protein
MYKLSNSNSTQCREWRGKRRLMMLAFVLGVVADEERKGEPLNKRKRQQSRYTSKRIDEKKLMYN